MTFTPSELPIRYKAVIHVEHELAARLQDILDKNSFDEESDRDGVIHTFTADFGNGWQADIKVCNSDGPYVDPVLFLDGYEMCVGEITNTLLGEYDFQVEDLQFKVYVGYPESRF